MLTCCIISLTNLHWQLLDKGLYVSTQISYLTLIITQNYFWPDSDMTWYVYAYTCTQLLCIVWRTKHDFYDLKKKLSCKEKKMCTSQKLHCAQLKWDQTDERPKKTFSEGYFQLVAINHKTEFCEKIAGGNFWPPPKLGLGRS